MRRTGLIISALLVSCLAGWSASGAADEPHKHAQQQHHAGAAGPANCLAPVHVTEDAERQPGGALYAGAPIGHHAKHGAAMPEMKGAHTDHKTKHGGAFFMAPNKIHHLEGVYSERCGFQLYLFNAFTKPIGVGRFQAFIRAVPSRDDEADIIRFLAPDEDKTVLMARLGETLTRPFEIELHLKFPESDEVQLFNLDVPAATE